MQSGDFLLIQIVPFLLVSALVIYLVKERLPKVRLLLSPHAQPQSPSSEGTEESSAGEPELVIAIAGLAAEHEKELRIIGIFQKIALVFIVAGAGIFIYALEGAFISFRPDWQDALPTGAIMMLVSGLAYWQIKNFGKETEWKRVVYRRSQKGREFVLTPQGIECFAGLLSGPVYEREIELRKPVHRILWGEIKSWEILPYARRDNEADLPARYRLYFSESKNDSICIERKYFKGREQDIIEYARRHLKVPIEQKDDLF